MVAIGLGERLRLLLDDAGDTPAAEPSFDELAEIHNRRIALSGRIDRIERWQVIGEEGHA